MPLTPGTRLGPYEILGPIGAGGMGEVYRAKDTRLDREVAIKVLPAAVADDRERLARFEREAKVLASLNHPNIAQIYGSEESDGVRALVMELVPGETLKGPVPLDTALHYARQIAEGLDAAHEKGITHRDLKPANIMVTTEGVVKILDFGLASVPIAAVATDSTNSPTMTMAATQAGMILGTAAYMSPEQARGKVVDKRADIWAFGVVLFELLSGKRLFEGDDLTETLASVVKVHPDLTVAPPRVRRLLGKCLEKDPRRRLRDIGDWEELLEASPREPEHTRGPVLPWAIAAAAGVLAVGLTVALWAAWRVPSPPDRPRMRLLVDLGTNDAFSDTIVPLMISPDGRRLVLSLGGRLWMRQLDQAQSAALPGTEGAYSAFFSPDGLWVGFAKDARLWKVSLQGGAPVALCDAPNLRGASWGPDGQIIAALDRVGGLSRVSESGGKPEPLTRIDPQSEKTSHRLPQVLADGAAVLFTAGNGTDPNGNLIMVQSLKTGRKKILWKGGTHARYLPGGHLVFVNQNTLYAAPMNLERLELTGQPLPVLENIAVSPFGDIAWYDVAQSGTLVFVPSQAAEIKRSIVRLSFGAMGEGQASPLAPGQGTYSDLRFSPDGKRLLIAWDQNRTTDIWVNDVARDAPAKLTFGPVVKTIPRWSPDGRYAFFFTRSGRGDGIAVVRADGTGEVTQLLDQRPAMGGYSISPDGKTIAFAERGSDTGQDLWTFPIDLTGGVPKKTGEPQVFLRTPTDETSPAISCDGGWLAYVSNESGQNEVYVRPFPGGREPARGKRLVSTGGGVTPEWSPNRHDLFYGNANGQIMVTPYTASGDTFSVDKPRLWSSAVVVDYTIAPDGKSVAAIVNPAANGDKSAPLEAVFLLNFFDELRRRVPASK